MDVDLRDALEAGFGPEPSHRPTASRLEAGHRAVRRRRWVGAVGTVAAATVVGFAAVAVVGDDGSRPTHVATDPTPTNTPAETTTPSATPEEDDSAGYIGFAPDGSLVSSHGVQILDQRHPVELKDFTFGDEPSGAALRQGPQGKKWYVLVRDIDGIEVIAVPFRTGGPDLDAFLEYATQKYASGVGLR